MTLYGRLYEQDDDDDDDAFPVVVRTHPGRPRDVMRRQRPFHRIASVTYRPRPSASGLAAAAAPSRHPGAAAVATCTRRTIYDAHAPDALHNYAPPVITALPLCASLSPYTSGDTRLSVIARDRYLLRHRMQHPRESEIVGTLNGLLLQLWDRNRDAAATFRVFL